MSGPRTKNHGPSERLPGKRALDKDGDGMERGEGMLDRENGLRKGAEAEMNLNSCLMGEEGPLWSGAAQSLGWSQSLQ